MCGIFCSLCNNGTNDSYIVGKYAKYKSAIERRGPDRVCEKTINLSENWTGLFAGGVLWMQGPELVEQPSVDANENILLWNGDIFSGSLAADDISDTRTLLNVLGACENIPERLKSIQGPYSLIYYRADRKLLYFARDPIGRHSLLLKISSKLSRLTLSSTANGHYDDVMELPAIGIFSFDLENSTLSFFPWYPLDRRSRDFIKSMEIRFGIEIALRDELSLKKENFATGDESLSENVNAFDISGFGIKNSNIMEPEVVESIMNKLSESSEIRERIERVLELLNESMKHRITKKPSFCKYCIRRAINGDRIICKHAKVGILFSGGLDSTILAALADEFVPRDESIDLISVAFEKVNKNHGKILEKKSPDLNECPPSFDVPDRKTGRQALAELEKKCPWRRWNFVESNITQEELRKYRSSRIRDLVWPLSTVLDDSLGCALWFASRGSGTLLSTGENYDSPCRILLLGMGADELFGGYTRHRTSLRRGGWSVLGEELRAELARISERNLGRDDRVVSDHGRQSRLPYLDEKFVEYVSCLNPWERCNPTDAMPMGLGDKLLLRLVAHVIGLCRTATFPKRAFQFGSRIANGKENAKDASKWG